MVARKFQYLFGGGGYKAITAFSIGTPIAPSGDAQTFLTVNGTLRTPAVGHIQGHYNATNQVGNGDSLVDDELSLASGQQFNSFIWDENTTSDGSNGLNPGAPLANLYGNSRYGMGGGGTDQAAAIDIFRSGQINSGVDDYSKRTTLINLGYNSVVGTDGLAGKAYNTHVTMIGGPGRDLFIAGENDDTLYGGSSDVIGPGHDALGDGLTGGGGNDIIYGGTNDVPNEALETGLNGDSMFGFGQDDILYGGNNGDFFSGDAGNDIMYGANGAVGTQAQGLSSKFYGGDGNDTMYASSTDPTTEFFYGGNSADPFVQNPNGLDAGGLDVVSYARASTTVIASLISQTGTAGAATGDTYIGIEGLAGGSANDTLTGDNIANYLAGNQGNDTLSGNGEADSLFGNGGDDLIFGGDQDDTIYGGSGLDTVFGDNGNDLIIGRSDSIGAGSTTGWDGTSATLAVNYDAAHYRTLDTVAGGAGTDTFNISDNGIIATPGGGVYVAYNGATQIMTGIEIIVASAAADVINLTNGSNAAYNENISIFAGDGADFVFSGSGIDLIVGDSTAGGVGADTLFGGSGDDLIFGDLQTNNTTGLTGAADLIYGGAGADIIYGGGGIGDKIDGGTGNDIIYALNAGTIIGGDGGDIIVGDFTAGNSAIVDGGQLAGDGNDVVFSRGNYVTVTANLGGGEDRYFGAGYNGTDGVGSGKDVVDGQKGDDAIAGWNGGDTLTGGIGNDVLWGGAGVDVIYGGDGFDNIYLDGGGSTGIVGGAIGDVAYGGADIDYFWVSRSDGPNIEIYDEIRDGTGLGRTAENYLIIAPDFSYSDGDADHYMDGTSTGVAGAQRVVETDHNIMDNAGGDDMVQVVQVGSTDDWRLTIIGGVGAGNPTTRTTVTFNHNDINQIVLLNTQPGAGEGTYQIYQWFTANVGLGHPTDGYYYLSG